MISMCYVLVSCSLISKCLERTVLSMDSSLRWHIDRPRVHVTAEIYEVCFKIRAQKISGRLIK